MHCDCVTCVVFFVTSSFENKLPKYSIYDTKSLPRWISLLSILNCLQAVSQTLKGRAMVLILFSSTLTAVSQCNGRASDALEAIRTQATKYYLKFPGGTKNYFVFIKPYYHVNRVSIISQHTRHTTLLFWC